MEDALMWCYDMLTNALSKLLWEKKCRNRLWVYVVDWMLLSMQKVYCVQIIHQSHTLPAISKTHNTISTWGPAAGYCTFWQAEKTDFNWVIFSDCFKKICQKTFEPLKNISKFIVKLQQLWALDGVHPGPVHILSTQRKTAEYKASFAKTAVKMVQIHISSRLSFSSDQNFPKSNNYVYFNPFNETIKSPSRWTDLTQQGKWLIFLTSQNVHCLETPRLTRCCAVKVYRLHTGATQFTLKLSETNNQSS